MSQSEQLVKRFSMYICIQEEYSSVTNYGDRYLATLMENLVQVFPFEDEEDWVRFFLKSSIEAEKTLQFLLFNIDFATIYTLLVFWNLANRLLFCYLQLVCYYAAKKVSNSFKSSSNLGIHYSLKECFSIASEIALKPAKLIKKFNFDSLFPVRAYAKQALKHGIQNRIARELKSRTIVSTNEGVLRNISPTQLKRALLSYGIASGNIVKYRLAWQCFNDLYETIRSLKSSQNVYQKDIKDRFLNSRQLELISARYNQQLDRIQLSEVLDSKQIHQLLYICVRAIRIYQNKELVSLELQPDLTKFSSFTDNLVEIEEKEELKEFKQTILNEFETLERKGRIALLLWVGLNLNQVCLLSFLDLKQQYQVARLFKSLKKNLLRGVIQAYWQSRFCEPMSENRVNEIVLENLTQIDDCLYRYAQNFFEDMLVKIITEEVSCQENKLLRQNSATEIQQKVCILFAKSIENKLQINLKQFDNIDLHLAKFVDEWLQQNEGILFNLVMR